MITNVHDVTRMVVAIVHQQELIMGPFALEKANQVPGLRVDEHDAVVIDGEPENILKLLIEKYRALFGDVSVQVCKDSVKEIIDELDPSSIPVFLK